MPDVQRYAIIVGNMAEGYKVMGPYHNDEDSSVRSLDIPTNYDDRFYITPIATDTKMQASDCGPGTAWVLHGKLGHGAFLQGPYVDKYQARHAAFRHDDTNILYYMEDTK